MTPTDENIQTPDFDDLVEETQELEQQQQEEISQTYENNDENTEIQKLKDQLLKTQADYQNFKMRSERDRSEMVFFLKWDIFKKILPRLDDLERIIKNTPDPEHTWAVYEWVLLMQKALLKDLENMWVKSFESIGQEVNPDLHEVMTQVSSETPGVIVDEFEKWYMLWDKVLRVAKVIVGN